MASAEKEAKSQSEYQRGVSAWNFDIEDLKVQSSLLLNDDEESVKSSFGYNCRDGFTMGQSRQLNQMHALQSYSL